ncbi:MAG TPA: AfsR/SARP family transcriptional regulator [Pseudonocardiaceae bacterium]|nr:AfsR/SARP family transcriptional regulator [Pseudonocardiaceae bacterium]
MRLDIQILGNLVATIDDVPIVPPAGKPRQILALLAINADRVVSTPALMTELWGQSRPRAASTTLHTYVAKLRRGIEPAVRGDGGVDAKRILITEQIGYRLRAPVLDVDASRYEHLAAAGRLAADRGDYQTASRQLGAALSLWRGPALSDIVAGPHLAVEVVRLEESRLSDLDLRIEADLRLGRHRRLLAELAGLCARYPLSESLCAKYMLALYRSGQQWRALDVFHRLRATMVEELGVDPSTELYRLHLAILRRDLSDDDATRFAPTWATTPISG